MSTSLSLSKKRVKELGKLKADAQALLAHQQDVLAHATDVAQQAGKQAQYLTREQVYPRVRGGYASYVTPAAERAGHVVTHSIVPAVGTVLGTALSVADIANDTRVKAAVKRVKASGNQIARQFPGGKKPKRKSHVGTIIGVSLGVAALAGVAYAVWQTFRSDDELWVADEPESTSNPES
ncbi:hypothetical protein ACFOYW_11440 [Gryllotalpicola reticulitermitis]|uniref:DNA helicase n=1 Tax=Gryllotalpicola reticulitermitis TaxID=1184153 RepID=A0ABV8Q9I5_9MICO